MDNDESTMTDRWRLAVSGIALFVAGCSSLPFHAPTRANLPEGALQWAGDEIRWSDPPPALPAGTRVAVLEGSPSAAAMFTMRLRVPAGAIIRPHWHPREERVTILSGELMLGFGDTVDETTARTLRAGSFYVNPPKVNHYLIFKRESVIQLTGMGPWQLEYVSETP